jgi:hypothetical protein
MSKKLLLLHSALFYLIASCTNNAGNVKPGIAQPKPSSAVNCYRYSNTKDTINLKLIHVGKSITGTLAYQIPDINTAKGTIQGEMKNDLLVATFSPFVDSTTPRQIAFRLVGNYFIEGVGETFEENGKITFKDPGKLNFNDGIKLIEFNCQK